MTLLAAFQTLLMRYSGQEDIAVGVPISRRPQAGREHVTGSFANTLVLRTDLSGQPTFRELLARVRCLSPEVCDYQDLPLEELVAELHDPPCLDRSPLFQVLFQLLDSPDEPPAPQHLDEGSPPTLDGRMTCDLEMRLWTQPDDGLRGRVVYSTDLFEAATIERLAGHFETLAAGIVADPDARLGQLPLLPEAERRQLLVEWNDTARDYPRERCVHQLFEEQAERTPDAVAVVFEQQQLTYRELNVRANQLAHYLCGLGVGPEVLVGLCVERSLEMVVGLLGILKAGGAYVPFGPDHPAERLKLMLQDSAAHVVVSQQSLKGGIPVEAAELVCLDVERERIDREPPAVPEVRVGPASLAYVMYTSGSTGRPKGVMVSHGSLVNCLTSIQQRPGLSVHDSLLAVSTLAFDIATAEVLLPLIVGARLIVANRDEARDAVQLQRLLARSNPTVFQATPVTWQMLLDSGWEGDRRLRAWSTGEALGRRLADELLSRTGELWNLYGPTETTIWSTLEKVAAATTPVRIGRPLANTRCYVLDACGQLAPIGVPGELCIGGDGLARGYLDRPELTAERFATSPFEAGARLYRTGDRVRWLADGTLEFLGRRDNQVKLRGFRIELGEIEAVLRQCPGVTQCVVVLREDRPGDKRLVGYYVPGDGNSLSHAELTAFVRERLPEYMAPATFVALERLPRTPNGKLDRRALPAPDQARPELGTGFVPPRDAVEEQLAAIWADLLGIERVGVHDNFFELGGDSLSAFRLLARVEQSFGKLLQPVAVFRRPTVAQFALGLQDPTDVRPAPAVFASQPDGSKPPLFLLPSLAGRAEYFQGLVKHLGPDQPILGIGFPDPQQPPRPFSTFEDLALWCLERIRESWPAGPYCLAGYSFSGMLAYEVARQLRAAGSEVRLVAILDEGPRAKCSCRSFVQYPWLVLKNLPFWITKDLFGTSFRGNVARLKRTVKAWTRRALGTSAALAPCAWKSNACSTSPAWRLPTGKSWKTISDCIAPTCPNRTPVASRSSGRGPGRCFILWSVT